MTFDPMTQSEAESAAEYPKTAIAAGLRLLDRIAYALEGIARELERRG